jgi:hypothetical protein
MPRHQKQKLLQANKYSTDRFAKYESMERLSVPNFQDRFGVGILVRPPKVISSNQNESA